LLLPSSLIEMDARPRFFRGAPLNVGKAAFQLLEGPIQSAIQPEIGQRARAGKEQRANLVVAKVRERTPIAVCERDAAVRAAFGIDRYPGSAEGIDVAIDRALGDFELLGQDASRALPARLEQQQQRNEPIGFHSADSPSSSRARALLSVAIATIANPESRRT
jgi:hypothetical protein